MPKSGLSLEKDCFQRLWRGCFYNPIRVWRQQVSREKRKRSPRLASTKEGFQHFLSEAVILYEYLILQYLSMLCPPPNTQQRDADEETDATTGDADNITVTQQSRDTTGTTVCDRSQLEDTQYASQSTAATTTATATTTTTKPTEGVVQGLYKLYIFMGDLHRYAEAYNKAERNYANASKLGPGLGNPYNQLAVVAFSRETYCVALYWSLVQASGFGDSLLCKIVVINSFTLERASDGGGVAKVANLARDVVKAYNIRIIAQDGATSTSTSGAIPHWAQIKEYQILKGYRPFSIVNEEYGYASNNKDGFVTATEAVNVLELSTTTQTQTQTQQLSQDTGGATATSSNNNNNNNESRARLLRMVEICDQLASSSSGAPLTVTVENKKEVYNYYNATAPPPSLGIGDDDETETPGKVDSNLTLDEDENGMESQEQEGANPFVMQPPAAGFLISSDYTNANTNAIEITPHHNPIVHNNNNNNNNGHHVPIPNEMMIPSVIPDFVVPETHSNTAGSAEDTTKWLNSNLLNSLWMDETSKTNNPWASE
eukprot:jgi/Psemu1/290022/fgenesh1_pg.438_\